MSDLNVLIATHNGANVLDRTLSGYAALKPLGINWKLILVDNASNDDTQSIIETYKSQLNLHRLFEPIPGKNRAMNRGLAAIDSDIVIMSDDDSIPHEGFLKSWQAAFGTMSNMDLFGGSIAPMFDVAPEKWILERQPRFEELYAQRLNIPAGAISPDRIYGPNMAMRASVLKAGLRFDEAVGPDASRKKSYAMGSETAFLRQAVAAGFKTGFAPAPTVSHIIREEHISADYIDGRAYRMGRGTAFKQCHDGTFQLRTRTLPIRAAGRLKRAFEEKAKQIRTNFGTDEQRFHARWDAHFFRGYQDEIMDWKTDRTWP